MNIWLFLYFFIYLFVCFSYSSSDIFSKTKVVNNSASFTANEGKKRNKIKKRKEKKKKKNAKL